MHRVVGNSLTDVLRRLGLDHVMTCLVEVSNIFLYFSSFFSFGWLFQVISNYFISTGRYILFDASQTVETARFVTPSNVTSYACLEFHYHMVGAHVGRLNVYSTGLYGNEELLWRLFGDQNDTWNEAHVPVNVIHPQYQVNVVFCRRIKKKITQVCAPFKNYNRYVCLNKAMATSALFPWCR